MSMKRQNHISASTWDYFFSSTQDGYCDDIYFPKPQEIRYKRKENVNVNVGDKKVIQNIAKKCKKNSNVKITIEPLVSEKDAASDQR